jgi:hypothetical protein
LNDVLLQLNYPLLPKSIFETGNIKGDLASMLNMFELEKVQNFVGFEGLIHNSSRIFSLKEALKSNTGDLAYHFNPYALHNRRVVLFGDSFMRSSLHIFSQIFSEVVYMRVPYILEDVVRVLEPDIVLTSNTERYLYNVPNCYKASPWFLNYISSAYNSSSVSEEITNVSYAEETVQLNLVN